MREKADSFSSRRFVVYGAALVASLALVVYFNTLWAGFVFDDGFLILGNWWIRDAGSLSEIFSSPTWGFDPERTSNYYRPLMHVVFMIDYHLFGLSPWGYHLVNITVHALNSILVFFIALRLFAGLPGPTESDSALKGHHLAIASAILFALHPVHVEAVAWVSAISEVGFALFFLLSLYLYIAADEKKGLGSLLSWLSFIAALLFKETAVMLIFVIVAYDLCLKRKAVASSLKRYIPYIIILGVYITVKLAVSGALTPRLQQEGLSGFQYFINIFPLIMDYLRLVFFPVRLNVFYQFHPVLTVVDFRLLASIIVIAPFVALFVIGYRGKRRAASFAWLLALFSIMPALYIAGAGARGSAFAERYLYLPSAGFIIFILYWFASFLRKFAPRRAATIFVVILVLLSAAYATGTVFRNRVWKDNYTLWKDSAGKTPDSELVYVNLGSAADSLGLRTEALNAYESALKINPRSAQAHNNLGVLYYETKEYGLSIENYEEALRDIVNQGERALIIENMGNVYYSMGSFKEAVERYQKALEIKGVSLNEASLLNKLGIALAGSGRFDEARQSFERALEITPSHVGARENLSKIEGALTPSGLSDNLSRP